MISYVKDLPEHVKLSDNLKEKADGYLVVQVYGKSHYVPLIKSMKKQFHIRRKDNKIVFDDWKEEHRLDEIVREIADSLYLQTRETVGTEIREEVVRIVTDRVENLIAPQVDKEIQARFEEKDKLLEK